MEFAAVWFLLAVHPASGVPLVPINSPNFYTTPKRCSKGIAEQRELDPSARYRCIRGAMDKEMVEIYRQIEDGLESAEVQEKGGN